MRKSNDLLVRISIVAILAVGFLLRINHWWDFLGADEIGKTGLMTWSWDFHKDPFPVHYYPPLFLYMNFLFSLVLKKVALFLGIIDFNNVFQHTDFGFIFTLKAGRLLSAGFGTLNIYVVYLMGRDFFNKYAGLCGALLLSVFWPHVIDSHNFKSDVLLTLLVSLMVYYTLKFTQNPKRKYIVLASFFLGLSVASKFNGAFFGFVLLLPLFYLRKQIPVLRNLLIIGLGTAAGFFLGAPNWLVHPVSNVRITLKYLKGLSDELLWYDPFPSSFLLYGKNLLEHFGIVILVLLAAGLIIAFLKKQRSGILISLFFLVYFSLAGIQNYLNYRAILPIIPLAALLVAKAIFSDAREIFRDKKVRIVVVTVMVIPVLVYTAVNFTRSYRSFDLLKGIASHAVRENPGIGEPDHSSWFIRNHLAGEGKVFREMWTPPGKEMKGVVFARDLTRVPVKMFSNPGGFNFLITSFRTDYILRRAKNRKTIAAARERLKGYLPFHVVDRPAIFTWSDDIMFWYRKPGYIRGNLNRDQGVPLPRTFVSAVKNTSVHLPLQRYEKNPCTGIVEDGVSGKYIYSTKKLKSIRFHFQGDPGLRMIFDVNGKKTQATLSSGLFTGTADMVPPAPEKFGPAALRRLYEADLDEEELKKILYIYRIEVRANTRARVPWTFSVTYEGEPVSPERPIPDSTAETEVEPVPRLFGPGEAPEWVRDFFKRNGIDLILLSHMNRRMVYHNTDVSVSPPATDYIPLERGVFTLNVRCGKILRKSPFSGGAVVTAEIISGNKRKEFTAPLKEGTAALRIHASEPGSFLRVSVSGARPENLMVDRIWITPDFRQYR